MRKLLLSLAAAVALPAAANAVTYSAVGDFSAGNPSGSWAYGTGIGGASFTAFNSFANNCFGQSGFSCHSNGDYLGIGLNMTAGDIDPFGTVAIPNSLLWMHPANGVGATDSIVTFTAATAGTYSVSGLFQRLTTASFNGSGDGVVVSIFNNGTLLYSSNSLAGSPNAATQASFNLSTALGAGSTLSFVVNNNSNYQFDSTGLSASITAVPEPAQWALMIGGFGLVGGAMRSRRRGTVLA